MPFGYTHSWLKEDDEFDRYDKPGSSDWFDLSDDVSFDKPNNRHDALKVESLLGYGGYLDLEKGGGVPLGLGGQQLRDPIKSFQAKNGLKVDGLLRPGGPTITRMKQLYGRAFAGSPAPTPAMMDAQAERLHEGKDGFMHGAAPAPLPRPNKRLDAKTDLFDYERWNRDWARNATDPASYAQEYESYIRQIEPTHGHDPGLVYARDFAQRVQDLHGTGGAFVKSLLNRLVDRPDLQREFLGGQVPQHPPQGTFRPGGEAAVKQWIDQDRVANGIAPRFAPSGIVQREDAPIIRGPYRPGRPLDPSVLMNHTLPMNASAQAPEAPPAPHDPIDHGPGFNLYDPNLMTPPPPPPVAPPQRVITVPLYPVPSVEEEVERMHEMDRRRRLQETEDQEELNRTAPRNPVGPVSGATFTEGISTGRAQAPQAPAPIPPPPAPAPRPPAQPPRAVHTPNAPIPRNPADRYPHPGGLRETDEQRRQRIENQQRWETERLDDSSEAVRSQTPDHRVEDRVPQWRMPVEGGRIREGDAQGEGHFGARRNDGPPNSPRLRPHGGTDIEAPAGANVTAPVTGRVREVRQDPNGGGSVTIEGPNGHRFVMHYVSPSAGLTPNTWVTAGETSIGTVADIRLIYPDAVGMTNHLHLDVFQHGRRRNPAEGMRAD